MPTPSRVRWLLAPLALLVVLAIAAPASASTAWGELGRFEGKEKAGAKKGARFLFSERTHMFGVDPQENGVFVGDELSEHVEGESFRIQKYTESGEWKGQTKVVPPMETGAEPTVESVQGFAIDQELGRIYLLTVYARSSGDKIDPSVPAAGKIYAFKLEPENEKLVSATASKEGVLASLEPGSETAGKALLEPRGITVDPKTHELLVVGENDEAKKEAGENRLAIERISSSGTVEPEYVDPKLSSEEEPVEPANSPVVSKAGKVYIERANQLLEVNISSLHSEPVPVFTFGINPVHAPFHEELVQFGEAEATAPLGGQLAIDPESEDAGKLITSSEVSTAEENGKRGGLINTALSFGYEDGGTPKLTELGWTGGVSSEEAVPCAIEAGGQNTLVAAGNEGDIFALTSRPPKIEDSEGEVVKFGPGGAGCPGAKTASPIEASLSGVKVTELDTTHTFTLSANISGQNTNAPGASVLSAEWSIGGEKLNVATPSGVETQVAEVAHKFTSAGEVKVELTIHTDNLAAPELKLTGTLHVKPSGFKVTKEPSSQEVFETQAATFEAAATGGSVTQQWEVSEDNEHEWKAITGQTSEKLEIGHAEAAQNGFLYRVTFTNGAEKFTTRVAKLTVLKPASPAITQEPVSVEVEEGHTTSFEAAASGLPTPTVQWELSTNGGKSFSTIAGGTTDRLPIGATTSGESGYQYRAVFTNSNPLTREVKTATTNVATLTVKKPPSPPTQPPSTGSTSTSAAAAPPTQQVQAFKEALARAAVASSSVNVSPSGAFAIKVSCAAGANCAGTITLKTANAVAARAHASKKPKKAILTLATASFTIVGGKLQSITLHLSSKGKKLLSRSHSIGARATVVAHNAHGETSTTTASVTLRPEKKKKHH